MVDMADQGSEDTFIYPLSGRDLVFLKTSPGQLAMMRRYADILKGQMTKAEAAGDEDAAMAAANKLGDIAWTAVESRFTSAEDLDFVRMEVIAGRITETQLYRILANGQGSEVIPDDDADVIRPAKKAAKKAAPRKRAAR